MLKVIYKKGSRFSTNISTSFQDPLPRISTPSSTLQKEGLGVAQTSKHPKSLRIKLRSAAPTTALESMSNASECAVQQCNWMAAKRFSFRLPFSSFLLPYHHIKAQVTVSDCPHLYAVSSNRSFLRFCSSSANSRSRAVGQWHFPRDYSISAIDLIPPDCLVTLSCSVQVYAQSFQTWPTGAASNRA